MSESYWRDWYAAEDARVAEEEATRAEEARAKEAEEARAQEADRINREIARLDAQLECINQSIKRLNDQKVVCVANRLLEYERLRRLYRGSGSRSRSPHR
jgi:hypothetical protein